MEKISYFEKVGTIHKISELLKHLRSIDLSNEFHKSLGSTVIRLIEDISESPSRWDSKCQFTLKNTYELDRFFSMEKADSIEYLELVTVALLPYALEYDLTEDSNPFSEHYEFMDLIDNHAGGFQHETQVKINNQREGFAIKFIKQLVEVSKVKSLNDYFGAINDAEKNLTKWETDLSENRNKWDKAYKARVMKVSRLEGRLKKQENQFNFVGLHKGFADLLLQKNKEYGWLRGILIFLSILTLLPIILESVYFISKGVEFKSYLDLIKFVPAITLTFIFIYYFKICLSNFSSVKAQIMQIRLRMSLCQFIQSYADYAKDIRSEDGNPLAKFEDIIFSNIMGSEDKMPATFDGIENIAGLINSLKPSK